jgi:polysaccharide pyruvyl transferase WcaK-like protein
MIRANGKYYVVLTGAKNNAGDFLIKERVFALLREQRPDRDLVDFNAWEPFTPEKLAAANGAAAVVLAGGPALRRDIHPGIYPLVPNLNALQAPVVTLGIGWKPALGSWQDVHTYPLGDDAHRLLRLAGAKGALSSVRDYHSLAVLQRYGYTNFVMTGCPALYRSDRIGKTPAPLAAGTIKRIGFSLGVGFVRFRALEKQMQDAILEIRKLFPQAELTAAFHHALSDDFLKTPGANRELLAAHKRFAAWLDGQGIAYRDISGGVEPMVAFYRDCDLHVGYRVHAHIFMMSESRPSILIAEDGRGKGLREVVGGAVLDALWSLDRGTRARVARRLGLSDGIGVNEHLTADIRALLTDLRGFNQKIAMSRAAIDAHFQVMRGFVEALP